MYWQGEEALLRCTSETKKVELVRGIDCLLLPPNPQEEVNSGAASTAPGQLSPVSTGGIITPPKSTEKK